MKTIFRNLRFYFYFFGYMLFHMKDLRRGEKALAAGDTETVKQLVNQHVPYWCEHLLKLIGVTIVTVGRENIPQGRACVFVANHRSYSDIPILLTQLDGPHAMLAKQETARIPLVNRWMKLLGCVFVDRDDARANLRALSDGTALVKAGSSFTIFPEGTRYKGAEGEMTEFKGGAFRIATKAKAPIVPVAISGSRAMMEGNHYLVQPCRIVVRILPAVETAGLDRAAVKDLPDQVKAAIQGALVDPKTWVPDENPYTRHYTQAPEMPHQS